MGSSPVGCTTTFHYYKSDVPVWVSIVRARTYSVHNRIAYYCTIGAHRFYEHSTYICTAFLDISLVCPLRLYTVRISQHCIELGSLISQSTFHSLLSSYRSPSDRDLGGCLVHADEQCKRTPPNHTHTHTLTSRRGNASPLR